MVVLFAKIKRYVGLTVDEEDAQLKKQGVGPPMLDVSRKDRILREPPVEVTITDYEALDHTKHPARVDGYMDRKKVILQGPKPKRRKEYEEAVKKWNDLEESIKTLPQNQNEYMSEWLDTAKKGGESLKKAEDEYKAKYDTAYEKFSFKLTRAKEKFNVKKEILLAMLGSSGGQGVLYGAMGATEEFGLKIPESVKLIMQTLFGMGVLYGMYRLRWDRSNIARKAKYELDRTKKEAEHGMSWEKYSQYKDGVREAGLSLKQHLPGAVGRPFDDSEEIYGPGTIHEEGFEKADA